MITLGLLRALTQRGLSVQPFKKGPDFIDPGWHRVACKRVSRNLDRFFMEPEQVRNVFLANAENSDISIIEGAMGLFDGMDTRGSSSSAEIAKITGTPVILVVDTTRMTRTTAALVLGCQLFDPDIRIVGVILNRVRGRRHEELIRETVESSCGIPVVGALPVDARLDIPSRHLGLLSSEQASVSEQWLDAVADVVAEHVNFDALLNLAQEAKPLLEEECDLMEFSWNADTQSKTEVTGEAAETGETRGAVETGGHLQEAIPRETRREPDPKLLIAVVRDPAFCFYYEENLLALEKQGAELVFVNSLEDTALPDNVHALYLGGGFPEMFAARLQANKSFRKSVREQIEADLPVYAECGGLMYLGRSLGYEGSTYEMVGALEVDTAMQEQRQAHGYSVLKATGTQGHQTWFEPGTVLKGHEYHHSKVLDVDPLLTLGFMNKRGYGIDGKHDGICYKGVVAVYTHVNAIASPAWAQALIEQARSYQGRLSLTKA